MQSPPPIPPYLTVQGSQKGYKKEGFVKENLRTPQSLAASFFQETLVSLRHSSRFQVSLQKWTKMLGGSHLQCSTAKNFSIPDPKNKSSKKSTTPVIQTPFLQVFVTKKTETHQTAARLLRSSHPLR